MDQVIQMTVGDFFLGLLIVAVIILVVFLIIAAYNLIKTLKRSQKVLDDLEVVVKITSKRTQEIDKIIEQMSKKIKSGQGVFQSIPIIVKTIARIAKILRQNQNRSAYGAEESMKK